MANTKKIAIAMPIPLSSFGGGDHHVATMSFSTDATSYFMRERREAQGNCKSIGFRTSQFGMQRMLRLCTKDEGDCCAQTRRANGQRFAPRAAGADRQPHYYD